MPDVIRGDRISRPPAQSAPASPDSIYIVWRRRLLNWGGLSLSDTSYTQLAQYPDENSQLDYENLGSTMEISRLLQARWRTYWLATVLCCGGALFGYDSGVIGTLSH